MFGIRLHQRRRWGIALLVVLAFLAAGSNALARNRTRGRGASAVAPQLAPVAETRAATPLPVNVDPEQAAADIAEIRRAVGNSPVDRVQAMENPFDSIVLDDPYGGIHNVPATVTVEPAKEPIDDFSAQPNAAAKASESPGSNEAIKSRFVPNGDMSFSGTQMDLCNRLEVEVAVSEIRQAAGYRPVDRYCDDASEFWLLHGPPERAFRSGSGRWRVESSALPERVSQLQSARDMEFHSDLQRVLYGVAQVEVASAPKEFVGYSPFWPEARADRLLEILSNWMVNETPSRNELPKTTAENLPVELRALARKLDSRAADFEDVQGYEDADQLRGLAERLRQEARRQTAAESTNGIFSFFTSSER